MKKLGSVYDSQEVKVQIETESAEDEIQMECQVLWETLCEADPEKNLFTSNAYKKFMVGCAAKLERMHYPRCEKQSHKKGRAGL